MVAEVVWKEGACYMGKLEKIWLIRAVGGGKG
jgi:hypothetical protein